MIILNNEPLSKRTTFHIGGTAEKLYIPESEEELIQVSKDIYDRDHRVYVISGGSNLLINDDRAFPEVVCMAKACRELEQLHDGVFYIGASVRIQKASSFVNSFGYGGTITKGNGDGDWVQHMNGQDIRIKSPTVMNRQQQWICRQAMDAAGMKEISFRVAGVFSNRHVTLDTGKDCGLWTKDSFFEELKTQLAVEEERISDPQKVVDQLVAITKKIRPEKKKKA